MTATRTPREVLDFWLEEVGETRHLSGAGVVGR